MLDVVQLEKHYGEVVALDGASFSVRPSRITGFLGPNGAGKTTTMRAIFGLVRPEGGSISWNGAPVGPQERLRFGYMPEERGLYPKMKVGEQLAYFGRLSGMPAKDASAAAAGWLQRLGLADRAGGKLEELSHGNQQRVQLVAALIHQPEVAVLDEPFSGLDPIGVDTMAAMLRSYAAGGAAILFSSHQLDLVEDVCEDVVIIHRGKVVLAGEVGELRAGSPVRHLAIEVDGRSWMGAAGEFDVVERNGKSHYLVSSGVAFEELVAKARSEGELTRLVFEPPSLSDLFREAVRS